MSTDQPTNEYEQELWERYAPAATPAAPPGECPPLIELAAFADGRLDDAQRAAVEAHLADCPDCRAAIGDVATEVFGAETLQFAPGRVIDAAKALVGRRRRPQAPAAIARAAGAWGRWGLAAAASIAISFVGFRAGSAWVEPGGSVAEDTLLTEMSFGIVHIGEPDHNLLMQPFEEASP